MFYSTLISSKIQTTTIAILIKSIKIYREIEGCDACFRNYIITEVTESHVHIRNPYAPDFSCLTADLNSVLINICIDVIFVTVQRSKMKLINISYQTTLQDGYN